MEPKITEEQKVLYREQEADITKIVETLAKLDKSKEWATLKELVFDKSLAGIERQMLSETTMLKIDTNKLYKLQGEWAWAKQFSDTNSFGEALKKQLAGIKLKLK